MVQNMTYDELILRIIILLRDGKIRDFRSVIDELQPYDMAFIFKEMPEKHRARYLSYLTVDDITDMIGELEREFQLVVLNKVGKTKATLAMNKMDNDDLAQLLEEMDEELKEQLLSSMEASESKAVQLLMNYPADSAGRMMTNRYVWIPQHYTVKDAVVKLKSFAEIAESINYLYVINESKQLVGVLSYRDLILGEPEEKVQDLMFTRVISADALQDQEEVARLIERYDFLAIPVVEENNVLVGIVTVDDIIDVVIREADEDYEKFAASGKDITFDTKAYVAAYRRLPWLILLLFIGLISGSIISYFEDALKQVVALAFFMPMVSGMTGNTGTQSLAVVIRGLSKEEMNKKTNCAPDLPGVQNKHFYRSGLFCADCDCFYHMAGECAFGICCRLFTVLNLNHRHDVRNDYPYYFAQTESRPGDCFWTADYNVKRYFIFINLLWHCHCIHSLIINVKSPSQLRAGLLLFNGFCTESEH